MKKVVMIMMVGLGFLGLQAKHYSVIAQLPSPVSDDQWNQNVKLYLSYLLPGKGSYILGGPDFNQLLQRLNKQCNDLCANQNNLGAYLKKISDLDGSAYKNITNAAIIKKWGVNSHKDRSVYHSVYKGDNECQCRFTYLASWGKRHYADMPGYILPIENDVTESDRTLYTQLYSLSDLITKNYNPTCVAACKKNGYGLRAYYNPTTNKCVCYKK